MALGSTSPRPYVVAKSGDAAAAPAGAVDIELYGAGSSGGSGGNVTADDITDATAVGRNVLKAADADAARTAIGAGTSNIALGTSATQAAAGNHNHSVAADAASGLAAAASVKALALALSARIKALEDAP